MDRGSKISIAASIMLVGATLALLARRNAVDVPRPDLLAAAQRLIGYAAGYGAPSVPQRIEQKGATPVPPSVDRPAPPAPSAPPPTPQNRPPVVESRPLVAESRAPRVEARPPVVVAQSQPNAAVTALLLPTVCTPAVAPPASRPLGRTIRHRIADGDTLARLAHRYLGSPARQEEIFAANRETLAQPDLLPIGVVLKIPVPDESGP
jgi:nucleoid-associated protein YgaU